MADPKMRWDKKQCRWRKFYEGRRFTIKAADLGGTGRDDTVVAANRWWEKEKAEWDAHLQQLAKAQRLYEDDYQSEMKGLQTTVSELAAMMKNPDMKEAVEPAYRIAKEKLVKLKELYRKESLPALDDSLRNPLHISALQVEVDAEKDAIETIVRDALYKYNVNKHKPKWLESQGYANPHLYSGWSPSDVARQYSPYDDVDCEDFIADTVEGVIDRVNLAIIRSRAGETFRIKQASVAQTKRRVGVIDDYTRGMLNQHMKEQGVTVPETQSLPHHIDLYVKQQERRYKDGKIKAGQLEQLKIYLNNYKDWATKQRIHSINAIGTIKAVDGYFYYVVDNFSPRYAKKLFNTFKLFVYHVIADSEPKLNIVPPWDNRRDDKYKIVIPRSKPEILKELSVLRQVYDATPPRLQLFIALSLNCGFGASEIGQLTKGEYDRKNGRIVHKRVKTEDCDNVPTVTYKLWQRTIELLDRQIEIQKQYPIHDEYKDRLLLNENGKGLWYQHYVNGSKKENDSISQQFERFIKQFKTGKPGFPKYTFYMNRRTAATVISNHKVFYHLDSLWLGHSPRSTAGRHYSVPDADKLTDCIVWLESKLFTEPIESENSEGDEADHPV